MEVYPLAKKHASAMKAHRQSLKRRAHNRHLRSQLRTALKEIRAAVGRHDGAKASVALRETVSLIDRMAGKGIIHRNAAARYKARLHSRLSA